MMFGVQLLHALAGNVRINLRGGDVGMPQEHLHHAQIRAVVEQVGSEGVAQGVREIGRASCRERV